MEKYVGGIHIVVRKENTYLVLRRSQNDRFEPGTWDLPGGGIGIGEQPLVAGARETLEEAGVVINTDFTLLDAWAFEIDNHWSLETLVLADYKSGETILSPEHDAFQWVTKEALLLLEAKGIHIKKLIEHINKI